MKDYTEVWVLIFNPKTGKIIRDERHRIEFKDYSKFENLPKISQAEETRREFEAYKKMVNDR